MRTIANYSGLLIERLTQFIRDTSPQFKYGWVWERQKRGALHVHAIVCGGTQEERDVLAARFRGMWIKWLKDVSRLSKVNLFWNQRKQRSNLRHTQTRAIECDEGASRYLAKYMSKTCRAEDHTSNVRAYYPVRWWRVDADVQEWCDESTIEFETDEMFVAEVERIVDTIKQCATEGGATVYQWQNKVFRRLPSLAILPAYATGSDLYMLILQAWAECHRSSQEAANDDFEMALQVFDGAEVA